MDQKVFPTTTTSKTKRSRTLIIIYPVTNGKHHLYTRSRKGERLGNRRGQLEKERGGEIGGKDCGKGAREILDICKPMQKSSRKDEIIEII